jgi:hypothetical protein
MTPFRMALGAVVVGAVALVACASSIRRPAEKLYLAVQVERDGAVLAQPHLLGEAGKLLTVQYVDPASPERARIALQLAPRREGDGYRVAIHLALPFFGEEGLGELTVGHGEERSTTVTPSRVPITVRLLLMRVDSPEFEAFRQLGESARPPSA